MDKEQTLQALEDKYLPLIQDATLRMSKIDFEKIGLENDYQEKIKQVTDYFEAVENIERMQSLLDNPPVI